VGVVGDVVVNVDRDVASDLREVEKMAAVVAAPTQAEAPATRARVNFDMSESMMFACFHGQADVSFLSVSLQAAAVI